MQESRVITTSGVWPRVRFCALLWESRFCPAQPLGQGMQNQSDDLKTSIARVQAGSFSNTDLETVVRGGAARVALPALEQQFARATDADGQGIVANALVRLGDTDNTYWNFLLRRPGDRVRRRPTPGLDHRRRRQLHR